MARKCKFDKEWEQALSLLSADEAVEARTIIEHYQQTGIMPDEIKPHIEMILLLVKPLIDRRRRASDAARLRRQASRRAGNPKSEVSYPIEPEPISAKTEVAVATTDSTSQKKTDLISCVEKARRNKLKFKHHKRGNKKYHQNICK